jgi:acyl-CoA thioester hydrolase
MYLQWCLDAAEDHWISKTSKSLRDKYIWVVLDHAISYKAPAFQGEEIEVITWVAYNKGVRSERKYKVVRTTDKKLLVDAKTIWCLLDAKTNRPIPVPEEISNLFI